MTTRPGERMAAVYYRDEQGNQPVKEYIAGLAPEVAAQVDETIEFLNRLRPADPPLPFPHSSQVEGELRELRCHYGRTLYRILYRRSDRLFVLLHVIEKHSKTIPIGDKVLAQRRWDDLQERLARQPRTRPRPFGSDAP